MDRKVATRLAASCPPEKIQRVIHHAKDPQNQIRNPAGYAVRALDEGWEVKRELEVASRYTPEEMAKRDAARNHYKTRMRDP